MSLVRYLVVSLAKRVAASPRAQRQARRLVASADRKMDKAADKLAEIVTAEDPAREVGKQVSRFLKGRQAPKD